MIDLLKKISKEGILIDVVEGKLELSSHKEAVDDNILSEIRTNQQGLISYLIKHKELAFNKVEYKRIPKCEESENFTLSNAQLRLWLISQIGDGATAYNMPKSIVLQGTYDLPCFQKAIHAAIERHEILRTVFKEDASGEVRQYVLSSEELNFSIDYKDFRKEQEVDTVWRAYVSSDANKAFDLSEGPLFRASILHLTDDRYVFYYNMHHIIGDAWSTDVLSKDVMSYYEAYRSGMVDRITPLRIQYKDYAVWQLNELHSNVYQEQKNYWIAQLQDEVTVLNLPTQKRRPEIKTYNGRGIAALLSKETTSMLQDFTNERGGSLFTGLLAAWKVMLYRYTGQTDITVGNPVAGRNHPDLENQIGFYVNTLALRNQLDPTSSFIDVFEQIRINTLDAYENQMYPFDTLVEDLGIPRDISRNPLFDILLNFNGYSESSMGIKDEDCHVLGSEIAKFDIELHLTEVKEGIEIHINFNRDVYEQSMVESLILHYKKILKVLVEKPEEIISKVDFLSREEKQKLLFVFNDTKIKYPKNKSIVDLFREQVQKNPEGIAVSFEGKTLSYKALEEQSNDLSKYLRKQGVSNESMVPICMKRSLEMMVGVLGILKAGGAYVPIDPTHPQKRIDYILEDINAALVLTQTSLKSYFENNEADRQLIFLDTFSGLEEEDSGIPTNPAWTPQQLAYVMYTSGSTGEPKGVMVEHKSVVRLVKSSNFYSFTKEDILLSTGSFSFDATTVEYWGPLLNGGQLALCSQDVLLDSAELQKEIESASVNIMWFTAGWFNQLVDTDIEVFGSLKTVIAGGDRLSPRHVNKLLSKYKSLEIINGYGPTENTTFSLTYNIKEVSGDIPIGYPLSNSTAFIMDDFCALQPLGTIGEICLGGDGIARGYLNQPKLTAEKFVINPYDQVSLLYKTGDLGRYQSDGKIEFLGRKDNQVKVRGYRIELGEIELALEELSGIEQSVVLAIEKNKESKQLVAYVVGKSDLDFSKIQEDLKENLPEYMVPKIYILMDDLPLTRNGKVDRKALPAPDETAYNKQEYVAPSNEVEAQIVAVWKDLLGIDNVSTIDNFFDLGGTSLSAIRVVSKYNKIFNKKVTIKDIFSNPILKDHVDLLNLSSEEIYKAIQKTEEASSYPLSNSQYGLWVASQIEENSTAYNLASQIFLDGTYDIECFQQAINAVIDRHEVLRTVFKEESGEVRQYVLSREALNFKIDFQDYRNIEDPITAFQSYAAQDAYQPFDLNDGPLFRAGLFQLAEDQYIFYYNMHHIVTDAWSMDVLSQDVLTYYEAFVANKKPEIQPLRIQYKDFAVWQSSQLDSPSFQLHKDYWLTQLSGDITEINLPTNKIRPNYKTYNGQRFGVRIDPEVTHKLRKFTSEKGGSLFTGILAVMNVLLYRYTGEKDIVLGNPTAGRDHADLERQIGFYINTLALRNQISPKDSFERFYNKIKTSTLDAYAHQIYPFDQLLEGLNIRRNISRSPLFDILVDYEGVASTGIDFKDEEEIVNLGNGLVKYDLEIDLKEVGQGIDFKVGFNTDVYEKEMVEGFMRHFKKLLDVLLENPELNVGTANFLTEKEAYNLLHEFNADQIVYPQEQNIVELFQEQAKANPNAIALAFENQTYTYKELDERSNQLAHFLQQKGIVQDSLVPVYLERSIETIVGILGILKSGGAYVPIDMSCPPQRLEFILEDTDCEYILSHSDLDTVLEEYEEDLEVIYLDKIGNDLAALSKAALDIEIGENHLAYVIYTSGTTGVPKGVLIEHGSIANYLSHQSEYFKVDQLDTFVLFASIAFDASVEQLFLPLLNGGKLVIPRKSDILDGERFSQLLSDHEVTHLHAVPSFLRAINFNSSFSLKRIISAGEAFDKTIFKDWADKIEIYNKYGPTEGTVSATEYKVTEYSYSPLSIGKPIGNAQCYILGEGNGLQPQGVVGEICIAGPGLARGYLNRPELTNKQFVNNPFVEGERMYKTGDLGAWLPDGSIAFYGRKDHQVKIRGYRIELGEIESVLNSLYNVEQAVVAAVEDNSGVKQLVAYIVSSELVDANSIKEGLMLLLEEQLPDYMVPRIYVPIDKIPLNQNGKVDRKALPLPGDNAYSKQEYVAPETEVQKQLVKIWEEVLSIDKVGVLDGFFDLGGHSLSAIRLIGQYNRVFNKKLTIKDIFANPVLESHVKLLELSSKVIFEEIKKVDEAESYPLSNAQLRLWFTSQIEEAAIAYNMPSSIFLDGTYDIGYFQKAIYKVIERHEILRTVFRQNGKGEVRQHVLSAKELNFQIDYKDFRSEENPVTAYQAYVSTDTNQPFDLEEGPIFRACLFQMSEDRYVFYYNMHHIVSDGWSMNVLSRDVIKYYEYFQTGNDLDLAPLRIQYKDYTAWQLNQLEKETNQVHKDFWLSQLEGERALVNLPSQKRRPQVKTYRGRSIGTHLSKEVTAKLRNYSTEREGSIFTGLLTVWKALLYRYTGQTDLTIGNPVAGREHPDLENQIGFYINVLALRSQINPKDSFASLFEQIKTNTLSAYEHQSYPFDKIIEDLEVPRDQSRSPLFDILVDYHGLANSGLSFDEGQELRNLGDNLIKFDIELHLTEVEGGVDIRLNFNKEVYEQEMIERLMVHYKSLIKELVENPEESIGQANYLSKQEEKVLLSHFNHTKVAYQKNKTILDLFAEQVRNTPDAIALDSTEERLTYQDLEERSTQLANCLIEEHEIKKGDFVGIHLDRSNAYIVAIFGILKAGGIYVPVDTSYPASRKQYLIEDAGLSLLITDTNYMFELDYYEGSLLAIDVEFNHEDYSTENKMSIFPEDTAYVIYTSGSTGNPKGVMIGHQSLNNYISWCRSFYFKTELTNHDFGLFTSPSFDLTITSLFLPLVNGGKLKVFSEGLDTFETLSAYMSSDLACIKLTPSHVSLLKDIETANSSLEMVIVGGEELKASHVEILQQINPAIKIYNEYGPTETTVGCIVYDVQNADDPIYIGKPIQNTKIYILDESGNLVPEEVLGEICIGGDGLSLGYLNRLGLTKEKFVTNPFNRRKMIYKTGDLGCWLSNGNIKFKGRKDHQVKVRGYRIELEEIEAALNKLEAVKESIVLAIDGENNVKQLVAYLVSEEEIIALEVQKKLEKVLPEYMVPKVYISLDQMPLTQNGKVDRTALPDPSEDAYNKEDFIAPVTEEEKVLATVWNAVLGLKEAGLKDNFYNLGGDSIKSIQIVARLRQHGYKLKVGAVLANPVLEEMAAIMEKVSRVIDQSEVEGEVELTPIQHYLFEDSGISLVHYFNQSILLKSEVALDQSILKSSVEQLLKHHDALRMVYSMEEGNWKQYNQEYAEESLRIDFYDLSEEEDGLKKMGEICENLQAEFDLANGPLFIVEHFRLSDGDRLAFICHHLIVDGVSWRILIEDLITLYQQHLADTKIELPQKTDSFQRWASLQKEFASSKSMTKEAAYWKEISNQSVPSFPTDKTRTDDNLGHNETVSFALDEALTTLMQTNIHEVYHTEINDLLLSGLGLAVRDVFGINKSIIHMEGHGREEIMEDVDISRTVGWFTSIYPFALQVSNAQERYKSLIKVKDDLRKIPNKGIGYGILKYLTDEFSSKLSPAIEFNYLGSFGGNAGDDEESSIFQFSSEYIGKAKGENPDKGILLGVSGMLVAGTLRMSISYPSNLFHAERMEDLVNSYREHLTALIKELSAINESHLTPSDLTFSNLSLEDLELINADGKLEDVYQFSPAQEGMYFNWLVSKNAYYEQFSYRITADDLNINLIQEAFNILVHRHSVLRTSFTGDYAKQLLQIVRKEVTSNYSYEKVPAHFDVEEQNKWMVEKKNADREKGFDLKDPSLMRLSLLDFGNGKFEFLWTYHHILMDGWCTSILINDFFIIFQSLENGIKLNLPKPRPYSNYINWLSKLDKKETLNYWKDYLSAYTDVATLPFRNSNSINLLDQDRIEEIRITGEVFEKINALCKSTGVTLNTFIQVAWGYLISRYNDTQDVVFGSVVSGRPAELEGIEDMVGLFLNTIPVRINYETEDSLTEVLKKTQEEAINSLPHHYASLSEVQGQSELGKSLIDHVIVFENFPIQELIEEQLEEVAVQEKSTITLESVKSQVKERTNYGFNLTVGASDTVLVLHFEYNRNRCDESLVKKTSAHFYNLLKSFIEQPDQRFKDIEYLTKEEQVEILEVFNSAITAPQVQKTVVGLFKEQVKASPDKTAIIFEEEKLTYQALDEKSDELAEYLVKQGLEPEALVPICVERSLEMMIGILAILKTGGAYVPIDATYPQQRIDFILKDTKAKFIITQKSLSATFENAASSLQTIYVDAISEAIKKEESNLIDFTIAPNQLAYVIYTSGTSGVPKGVMIPHSAFADYVNTFNDYFELTDKDSVLQQASISFDTSIEEIFPILVKGGTLYIASAINDFENLIEVCEKEKITILSTHPYLVQFINENADQYNLSLRILISGGDVLKKEYLTNIVDRYNVYNTYGPTESTVCVSYAKVENLDSIISIGHPIANKQIFILSEDSKLQPVGVTGELCIGGAGLAKGYLNLPELTDEKFIDHPFQPEEKIYKTGDLARWLADGTVEFLGRKDHQVKILGYRIELGEIESVLDQLENVDQSCVLVKENENGVKQLVAFVVCSAPVVFEMAQEHLERSLPHYMIPRAFELLEKMPLTTNGKMDKKALSNYSIDIKKPFVAPATDTQIKLSKIWQDALGLEQISINDDFFELGGNSISAVKITLKVSKEMNMKIDIKSLFDAKTVADLAHHIDFSLKQKELKTESKILKQIL